MQRTPIPALHGLRFLAAMLVVFAHAIGQFFPATSAYGLTNSMGEIGMSLFFVLSGFVIHYNYGESLFQSRGQLVKFYVARFARLYPLLFVLLLSDIVLYGHVATDPQKSDALQALPYDLTFTNSWFPFQMHGGTPLITSGYSVGTLSWSISTEWGFYIAYPLIALGIGRLTVRGSLITLGVASLLMWVVAFEAGAYGYTFATSLLGRFFFYTSPYARVFDFLLGALAAQAVLSGAKWPKSVTPWCAAAIAAVVISKLGVEQVIGWKSVLLDFGWISTPFIAIAIYLMAIGRHSLWDRVFAFSPFVSAGEVSYSIYLLQGNILTKFGPNGPEGSPAWTFAQMMLAILVTIALSFGTYALIERPARDAIRRWVGVRSRSRIQAAHSTALRPSGVAAMSPPTVG